MTDELLSRIAALEAERDQWKRSAQNHSDSLGTYVERLEAAEQENERLKRELANLKERLGRD